MADRNSGLTGRKIIITVDTPQQAAALLQKIV